jgi:putative phage-type endonuclease
MEDEIRNQLNELLESEEDVCDLSFLLKEMDESYSEEEEEEEEEDNSIYRPNWKEQLSEEELMDLEEMVMEWIDEYLQNEVLSMSSPHFQEQMVKEISVLLKEQLIQMQMIQGKFDDEDEEVEEFVKEISGHYFDDLQIIPPRSFKQSIDPTQKSHEEKTKLKEKIEKLLAIPQPKQKTTEWYEYRHQMITASNLWKVFGSESQRNSLIYEKCKPFEPSSLGSMSMSLSSFVNVQSPLHWGVKYEPVSVQLYERKYGLRIADVGCICHPKHPYIGASPDGIVVSLDSPRYGRMIEIKNIFNREINGIPKEEYWIQMQIQMETWDLEECDFIETRFKEFETEEDFYSMELLYEHRGVILYFVKKSTTFSEMSNVPHYEYMPMDIVLEKSAVDEWIQQKKAELHREYSLYAVQYWYLDEWSCVTVRRNREWIQKAIPKIEECWSLIEKERVEGYDHRASKPRSGSKVEVCFNSEQNTQVVKNMPFSNSICLVKLDECGVPLL